MPTITIDGQTHQITAAQHEAAVAAYRARIAGSSFTNVARTLQASGIQCDGRNTARRLASAGARITTGIDDDAQIARQVRAGVDATRELLAQWAAGSRVTRRRSGVPIRHRSHTLGTAGARRRVRETGAAAAAMVGLRQDGRRTIGFECEYLATGPGPSAAATLLNAAGISATAVGYSGGSALDSFHCTTDATCGYEIRGVVITDHATGWAAYRDLFRVLKANGATVDNGARCGGHVHIGARDLTCAALARLVTFYAAHQSLIDQWHTPQRRGRRSYVGALRADEVQALVDRCNVRPNELAHRVALHGPRLNVNVGALSAHGTVEFRQHAGTLNVLKLRAWARFCCALVDAAHTDTLPRGPITTPAALADAVLGAGDRDARYLAQRAETIGRAR